MLAVALGLSAGIVYGVADFVGGLASRRAPLLPVLLISQVCGTVLLTVAFPFIETGSPSADTIAWGAAAGVTGAAGVAFLYRGLSRGQMSVVAPITAVNAASLPVIYGLATGERPGALALFGAAVALAAIALVSSGGETSELGLRARFSGPGVTDALLAGAGFGLFFIFLSYGSDDSSLWPLVGARIASLSLFVIAALVTRTAIKIPKGSLRYIAPAGLLDVAANLLYVLASREGLLSLVAVLTSLYPASTVLLARFVLREKLVRIQLVGLVLAATGVVLLAS